MRILLVSQKPNAPTITGEMVFVDNLTRGLLGRGIETHTCAVETDRLEPQCLSRLLRYSRAPGILRARRMLRGADDYDIIHFLDSSLAPAGLGKKAAKIATVHVLGRSHYLFRHGGTMAGRAAERLYWAYSSALDRFAFGHLNRIIALSPYHAQDMAASYSLPEAKVGIIPPGVDFQALKSCRKTDLCSRFGCERTALYIARLDSPAKGLGDFIAAADVLRDEPIAFLVVGDGFERARYEKVVREKGLGGKVFFMGALGFEEKNTLEKSADAVVVPSVSETFCMVFAEALAAGTPVVAYDMPFWKGLYDGAGVFVKRDAESLAMGILRAAGEPSLRAALRRRGQALASKYRIENTVSAYIRLYEGLC